MSSFPLPLFVIPIVCIACGSQDAPIGPDAGPDLEKIWQEIEACELVGTFRVETSKGALCSEWPQDGESIAIHRDGDQPYLRVGALELPIDQQLGNCAFVAGGCSASSDEFAERYLAPSFRFEKSADGVRLDASAIDVNRGYVGSCGEASFVASAVAACDPLGSYEAAQTAPIQSGSCDLQWGEGQVEITLGEEGYDLAWGSTEMRGLQLDPTSCTLRGARGGANEFWLYNNAMRTAEIEVAITSEGLTGWASDQLEGETFDGKVCPGATFDLQASRPAARETERYAETCEIAKPVACGDGVCEVGESCFCEEDCGCQGELTCAPDGECRASCTIASEPTACAEGERCSPTGDSTGTLILPSDMLYCDGEGPLRAGEICTATTDCAAGLVCHYAMRSTVALCAPPCGEGLPECAGAGEICGAQGDGSGSGSYPTAVRACEYQAQMGEDCSIDSCASGLSCLSECINGNCEKYCTRSCSSGCPPELPVCGSIGVCTRS